MKAQFPIDRSHQNKCRGQRSHSGRATRVLLVWLSLVGLFVQRGIASTFLPTPAELINSPVDRNEFARQLIDLPVQTDETGRRFYEIDDMRMPADSVQID